MTKIHRLKTVTPFFDHVRTNRKTFEIRPDDRGYEKGDYLVLDEYEAGAYTKAKPIVRIVTYLLPGNQYGIEEGFVVLGIDELGHDIEAQTVLAVAPDRPLPASTSPTKADT